MLSLLSEQLFELQMPKPKVQMNVKTLMSNASSKDLLAFNNLDFIWHLDFGIYHLPTYLRN